VTAIISVLELRRFVYPPPLTQICILFVYRSYIICTIHTQARKWLGWVIGRTPGFRAPSDEVARENPRHHAAPPAFPASLVRLPPSILILKDGCVWEISSVHHASPLASSLAFPASPARLLPSISLWEPAPQATASGHPPWMPAGVLPPLSLTYNNAYL
jgi:hypothetical protein